MNSRPKLLYNPFWLGVFIFQLLILAEMSVISSFNQYAIFKGMIMIIQVELVLSTTPLLIRLDQCNISCRFASHLPVIFLLFYCLFIFLKQYKCVCACVCVWGILFYSGFHGRIDIIHVIAPEEHSRRNCMSDQKERCRILPAILRLVYLLFSFSSVFLHI